jgi:hypothetical protein
MFMQKAPVKSSFSSFGLEQFQPNISIRALLMAAIIVLTDKHILSMLPP